MQWRSARTTNAIERLHEEFKRRIKTQTVLPSAETAAMLFWALLASGQITIAGTPRAQRIVLSPCALFPLLVPACLHGGPAPAAAAPYLGRQEGQRAEEPVGEDWAEPLAGPPPLAPRRHCQGCEEETDGNAANAQGQLPQRAGARASVSPTARRSVPRRQSLRIDASIMTWTAASGAASWRIRLI